MQSGLHNTSVPKPAAILPLRLLAVFSMSTPCAHRPPGSVIDVGSWGRQIGGEGEISSERELADIGILVSFLKLRLRGGSIFISMPQRRNSFAAKRVMCMQGRLAHWLR